MCDRGGRDAVVCGYSNCRMAAGAECSLTVAMVMSLCECVMGKKEGWRARDEDEELASGARERDFSSPHQILEATAQHLRAHVLKLEHCGCQTHMTHSSLLTTADSFLKSMGLRILPHGQEQQLHCLG